MNEQKQASIILSQSYNGGQATEGGHGFYLDTPVVQQGRHRIIYNAACSAATSGAANFGTQLTGIFICPNSTPPPADLGSVASLPFRYPSADPYEFFNLGFPTNIADDGGNEMYFNGKVYLPSLWFIRFMYSSSAATTVTAIFGSLQYLEEDNC